MKPVTNRPSSAPRTDRFFAGGTAIVTGAASGIGLATVRACIDDGAQVVMVDCDPAALDAAAQRFDSTHVLPVVGDVSQWADCERAAEAAHELGGPVLALVNSAASFLARGADATARDWDESLGVNVKGTALMASATIPALRRAGRSAIVNVASISARIAQPHRWTYNATKSAIVGLTRCQALDLAGAGIRVNSVSPGTIWTAELDRLFPEGRTQAEPALGRQHMLGRVGEPTEVASVIVFLCGPGASFITGTDVLVDGGYVAMGHDPPEQRYSHE